MATLEDRLQQFGEVAADAIDGLMALMPASQSVAEDADAAGQLLQRYSELVQSIAQFAWDSGLEGLHSVCVQVESNLMLLQSEARPLSADEIALLEGWPMLLFGYMANRADTESSTALLQSLSTTWPMPLPEESVAEELQRLTTIQVQAAPAVEEDLFDDALLNIETQQVEREMLGVLSDELAQMAEQFHADLDATTAGTPQQRQAALEDFRELMRRMGATLGSVGLSALAALFEQFEKHLAPLGEGLSEQQQTLLQQLPGHLAAYLAAPNDEQACAALAALLADMAWSSPVDQDALSLWQEALCNVQLTDESGQSAQRQTTATWEDVSLELPSDVNRELLDGLLQELPVQVGAFTAAIGRIAGGEGGMKDAERAMRAAHTLKGAANTVGVPGIANLTHQLEDILVALIDEEKLPQHALADVLINAGDCLEAMSEYLLSLGPAPEQSLQVLQQVLDCANRIDREGVSADAVQAAPAWAIPQQQLAEPQPKQQAAPMAPPHAEQTLRVPAPVVDELLRLAGETLISNSQIQEHLRQSVSQAEIIRKQHNLIQQLVAELEELVDIRGVTSSPQAAARKDDGFDTLEFEHYSELHTVTRRLIEAATDAQEMTGTAEGQLTTLEDLLEEQHRLHMGSQHALMRTRMVAVSTVVSRLQRGVRQTGRLLDKPVELTIKGENTTIDSNVLNDLIDPLMHILRNAVDHGIESPEARLAACKPQQGRIELSFAREGNSIVVRCSDDGAGLDYAAIRDFAERKGMLSPEHEHTEEELARLILAPGFSTREHASQVSGRGVGMDVVYSRVLEMKGMLALNSRRGQGLMVELRLPATLLSAHTLIVRQHKKLLAISSRGVEDIRYVAREQISEIGQRQYFREGDEIYGLVKLEKLLSLTQDQRSRDKQGFPVLLTRLDDGSISAVLVQEIIDSREVVMKKFGRYVPRTQGVIGAVILGDGSVAPVIDLVELQHVSMQPMLNVVQAEAVADAEPQAEHKALRALVVDDSLSALRSLVQVLKDAEFEVRTANDGMEAVSVLEGFVPDIILTDMEMPRMNGLELTANVRHTERTRNVPIIMITSRSTEKHRQMSAAAGVDVHLIKPFSDDVLLQHVMRLTGK
ncbi:MAG: response regulator [Sideroxydans sp.]|nr:response regulator [Sideroxydans sp.]